MRKATPLAVALAVALFAVSAAAQEVRVLSQTLAVQLEPKEHRVTGTALLGFDPAGPTSGTLSFRLHSGLSVTGLALMGPAGEASVMPAVDEVDGYWRKVEVKIPEKPAADRIRVTYVGTLYDAVKKADDLSFVIGDDTRGVVGEEGVYLVASSGWYPLTGELTTFRRVRVTVAGGFRAVTQGRLVDRSVAGGREHTVWENDKPMDGLALQAGAYAVDTREVLGVAISTYLFEKDRPHAKLFLDEAEKYIRFYTPLLGAYPWPKFDIVENFFTTGYGMPSFTLLGNDVVQVMVMMAARSGGSIPPGYIDHEMVHCWWGNYVYPDYDKGNWCEGLTSYYSNYLRKEQEDGPAARAHRKKISTTFGIRVRPDNDYPLRAFRGKTEDFENDIGYGKSSMLFHMLRRLVSADVFFETMRGIVRDFGGRAASWDDFEAAFSKAAGQDLSWFFSQWLDRTGAPALRAGEMTVSRRADANYVVRGEILQDGRPYRLDVPVTVEHAGGESFRSVPITGARTEFEILTPRPPLSLNIDKRFDLFRHVPLDEIQPCLNLTLSRPDKVYVVPEGAPAYRRIAEMARGGKGGEIVPPGDGLPAKDCVLFGRPEENPAVAAALKAAGVEVEGNAITINGKKHEDEGLWLLLSTPHPSAPGRFVTVFFGVTEKALSRARVIFHYGWDGFLAYAGRRPLDRGDFTRIEPRTRRTWPLAVDPEKGAGTIKGLAKGELAGRLAGSPGDVAAREQLKAALLEAGVEAVTEAPFSFDVLDFDDEDAWTVPMGTLEDGTTKWTTSFPGAVVPAVFSAEAPEGVLITRIVKYGGEVPEGSLVVLPPEKDPEAIRVLLAMLADSKAAAVGIPMEVLEDRRAAALAAFPSRITDTADPWLAAAGRQVRVERPKAAPDCPIVFLDRRLLPPDALDEARVRLRVRFTRKTVTSANIVGVIKDAAGRQDGPFVGLSAHYDGLGEGHQGADDNASGVAAVIEASRALVARRDLLSAPVKVMLFGAEEWGLRGSRALAAEVAPSLSALVNLDTVGAADAPDVFLIGRSEHADLSARAAACLEAEGFSIGRDIDRFAFAHGSDHWPFHMAGVPVVDLFSGQHRRMNSKDDTLDLVDPAKVARVARGAARLVLDLASENGK